MAAAKKRQRGGGDTGDQWRSRMEADITFLKAQVARLDTIEAKVEEILRAVRHDGHRPRKARVQAEAPAPPNAAEGLDPEGFYTCDHLADHFTVNPEALRHRLKRWKRSPAYTTDAVRVAKDGRLRYHLAPVRHLIEDLRGGRKSRFKA